MKQNIFTDKTNGEQVPGYKNLGYTGPSVIPTIPGVGAGQTNPDGSTATPAEALLNQEKNPGGASGATGKTAGANRELAGSLAASLKDLAIALPGGKISSVGRFFFGSKKRRRTSIATSAGSFFVAVVMVVTMFFAGPQQAIQIAKFLEGAHFISGQTAGDIRLGKAYRYVRAGGDAGETRVGYLGSKLKGKMIADMSAVGLEPQFGEFSTYKSFKIDTTHKKSPFYGMSDEQIKLKLAQDGFTKGVSGKDGKISVDLSGYSSKMKRASLRTMIGSMGYSKLSTAVRARSVAKYGWVTWHPLAKLDQKTNAKLSEMYDNWKTERNARLKSGIEGTTIDPSAAKEENTDAKGNKTLTDVSSPKETLGFEKIKTVLSDISGSVGGKIAGGVAAVVGIVCAIKAVHDGIAVIQYAQTILPLQRVGLEAVTDGNQIASGRDVDGTSTDFVSKSYNKYDKDGKLVSTWAQAASIRGEQGKTGGIDMDQGTKDILKGNIPAWLTWVDEPGIKPTLNALCSGVGQVATTGVSVVISVFTGSIASTAIGLVAGAIAGPIIIDRVSNLLAGDAVDVAAQGAEWGNNINYGTRLAANGIDLQTGANAINDQQLGELNVERNQINQQEFDSQNLAYKLFDAGDSRTLYGSMIAKTSPYLNIQGLQNLGSAIPAMFSSMLRTPASLLTGHAKADSLLSGQPNAGYKYPFPKMAFSLEEQDSSRFDDIYANADKAATILDSNTGIIKKAHDCYGVDILKVADEDNVQRWDVVPANDIGTGINPYAPEYKALGCQDPANDDWQVIRFFILDTATMEGWGCYNGDSISCQNDGFPDLDPNSSFLDDTPQFKAQPFDGLTRRNAWA